MSSKIKTPKRLERKAKLPEESGLDAHKAKKTNLGRPQGFQKKMDLTKTTKAYKLALLHHLNESCPGLMVWAKSWKFSQPLPQPQESPCAFDWGQSWKFLNVQPCTDGKPWFNLGFDANNNMSSNDMFLWEKLSKVVDSECIQQDLVSPEWENSWIFTQKRKECIEKTNKSDCNKFTTLWRDQNEESALDWKESWRSTKPVKGDVSSDLIQPTTDEEKQPELSWNNSWKQLHMKSKTSNNSGWSESWRVVKTISKMETKSIQSQAKVPEEVHPDICNVIMNVSREMKHAIPWTDAQPSEWEKSWVAIKNRSEYKEEMTKEVEVKAETLKPDNFKQPTEHVKFDILALPRSQKRQEMLNFSEKVDWKDSWKMLKRQRREEGALRNQRCSPSQFSQTLTEWADSWRITNLTLNQDSGLWQQGWSTNAQPRTLRRERENEDIPHNGPAGVRTWAESWRSMRRQHLLERQAAGISTQLVHQHANARSLADWEQSWTSSTHHQCNRPSMTAWNDSWRFSTLEDLQPEHAWSDKSMELIKASNPIRRSLNSQRFKERSSTEWNDSWKVKKRFDGRGLKQLMKNEVLDWDNSWLFTSTEVYQKQGECYSHVMLKPVQIESRSEWGRSWKMSNPQPPKNIASWVDAKPKSFNAQELTLWSKHKHIYYLPSASPKDLKLKFWAKSWRFMKMELDSKHGKDGDESVIMIKTTKTRKEIDIDQQKPQMKRWSDAYKMAKTQLKRSFKSKSGNIDDEEMIAEWMESWKFSNDLKTCEPGNWKNSWKFLLDPNVPMNGPQTCKSR